MIALIVLQHEKTPTNLKINRYR